ncbi:MAG: baseplate J/gp47 family protein [Chloroflexi bacterium]|nr:baseplate J/gp47 family protein [Chloroflexota bacterium]
MKTQIIALESHDDLISVRDKLSWAKTPRILLVLPKSAKVNLRLLDWKVLQRHADSLGAQLGLVTRRASVKRDAASLGIPVFDSTAAAQREPWNIPARKRRRVLKAPRRDLRTLHDEIHNKREPALLSSLPARAAIFTAGVLAFLALAGLFIPRAALTLYPEEKKQSVVISIAASDSTREVSLRGLVPAREADAVVSAEESLSISSRISVPKSKSKGIVRFTNLSQNEVNIPAGATVTTSSGFRFVTLNEVRLPPGMGRFVETPVEALQAGEQGNVAENTINLIEGSLGLSVSVSNPQPLSGGSNVMEIGATEEDRARLRGATVETLLRKAEAELRAALKEGDLLFSDTVEPAEIIEEVFAPLPGEPGNVLTLKMKVRFTARYVSAEDLLQLSLLALDASLEDGFEAAGAPAYQATTAPFSGADGVVRFEIEASRPLLRRIDKMAVFALVRGLNPRQARAALTSTLSLRQSPKIEMTPSWYPWLPLIPFNLSITLQ